MKRSHGGYSKSSRNFTSQGKLTMAKHLAAFQEGDRVRLVANPATKAGRPFLRFNGVTGKVVGKQGNSYKVAVPQGNSTKVIVISNLHIVAA